MRAQIDRLVLDIPGLSAAEGERLAARVAAGLAGADWSARRPVRRAMSTVQVDRGDGDLDRLAARIVDDLLQQWGG